MYLYYSFENEKLNVELQERKSEIDILKERDAANVKFNYLLGFSLFLVTTFGVISYFRRKKLQNARIKRRAAERQVKALEAEKLKLEVENKKQQLTDFAIHITEKNDLLEKIKKKISATGIDKNDPAVKDLLLFINDDIGKNKEKSQLYTAIDNTHDSFYEKLSLTYPNLSDKEKKVATLIRLGHSSKQIALQLNISKGSANNYRYSLRKKLNLPREENLTSFIKAL